MRTLGKLGKPLQAELKCTRCQEWWPRRKVISIKNNNVWVRCYRSTYVHRAAAHHAAWVMRRRIMADDD